MEQVIEGVTLHSGMETKNPVARKNMETIVRFFSLYLKDKEQFYSLWCAEDPQVVTPFTSQDIAVCQVAVQSGWDGIKRFWDPIFDEMTGRFDWFIDRFVPGENPNVIVTLTHSAIDLQTGPTWGNRHVKYNGRYVQIFGFVEGKVKSFEEYYDTALLNAQYGA
jgi:hypothetical protein